MKKTFLSLLIISFAIAVKAQLPMPVTGMHKVKGSFPTGSKQVQLTAEVS